MTILELREKRAKAWDAAKAFLDSHRTDKGTLSAEDDATYSRMEQDISDLGKEIARMERREALDAELNKPVSQPITGKPAGDQQAALFGQLCFDKGDVKNTYGTGNFILMNTGNKPAASRNGLITTIASSIDGNVNYALEGSVFVGGAVIQWLRDEMRFFSSAKDADYLGAKLMSSEGVYFVPSFTGMGAPHWDMYARGAVYGLTRGTTREHIIRAALEGIAFQSMDVINAMAADTGNDISTIKVDGGASASCPIMQFQADITGKKLIKPVIAETTALGAAFLAGLAVGFWKDKEELKSSWVLEKTYEPKMDRKDAEKLIKGWNKAVLCTKMFAEK